MQIENFGRNVSFNPNEFLTPESEDEVLEILNQHRGKQIRVAGRLHSWSPVVATDEVLIDLRQLNSVDVERRPDGIWATIGGGCQIKKALADLEIAAGATLPAVGLITEQAIAGAISTGTHGSGRQCLSHFVSEIRVAIYDPVTGNACIRTIIEGRELQAAQCSLGCLGVILSVGLWCRPQYHVEEYFRRYSRLEDVLAAEDEYPLQQFYLVPWSWDYFVQHRREASSPRSRTAWLYRIYCFLTLDLAIHIAVILLCQWIKVRACIRFFFRLLLPCGVIRGLKMVDVSHRMLTMKHELFRHIEIEVFVKQRHLHPAIAFSQALLRHCDGEKNAFSEEVRLDFEARGLAERIRSVAGTFTYSYIICVRKVLPDATLISMSSGEEPSYALNFISFARPSDRQGFFGFANCLCECLSVIYEGRPHWGKVCPLPAEQVELLYPGLPEFRRIARAFDGNGVFRNRWVDELLFSSNQSFRRADQDSQS